ncbi:MAG: hypothetical protein RLZZ628_3624 [Bacteroidota bacterium]|jgi:type IX secretion system PorP/SprF family membrane protein
MNVYFPQCRLRARATYIGLLISIWATAQDVHFSNAAQVPLYLNPAQTGFFDGQAAVNLSNRLQSFSTNADFSTTALSYQHRFQKSITTPCLAIGGQLQYEKATTIDLTNLNLDGAASYSFPILKNGTFRIGGMMGVHQRANSNAKLLWGDQFRVTEVDPNTPSRDLLAQNQKFLFLDISAGLQYHQKSDNGMEWNIGLGMFHLNKPAQRFGQNSEIFYPVRLATHGGVTFLIDEKTQLQANGWVQLQSLALFHNEVGEQVTLNYALNQAQSVEIGILARQNIKAGWVTLAPQLGFKYEDWRIATAYDVNLNSACLNCKNGGFEVHISKIVPLAIDKPLVTKRRKVSPSSDVATSKPASKPSKSKPTPKPVIEPTVETTVEVPVVDDLPTEIYEPTPLINKANIPTAQVEDRASAQPTPPTVTPSTETPSITTPSTVTPIVLPSFPIALYFDNDVPKVGSEMSYEFSYLKYIASRDSLQQLYSKTNELPQHDRTILDFFDNEVIPNFAKIYFLYDGLYRSMLAGETLEVTVSAGTSDVATFEYNRKLAQRRFESFYSDLRQYQNGALIPYLDNKQLIVNLLPFQINAFPTANEPKKLNAIIGIDALQRRKVEILNIKKL